MCESTKVDGAIFESILQKKSKQRRIKKAREKLLP